MTNTTLLKAKIDASGYKMKYIANRIGLSYQGFLNKIRNKTDFTAPEIKSLCELLHIGTEEMAVDRDNVGQDGRRATDWLNFVAWRKTAEFVCQYFRKGSTALVECQCQTRSYEDKNGQKRTATEFVVQKIHFCGPKTEQRVDDGGEAPPPGYQQPPYQNQQPQQMGFATQNQRQQWQQPSYSQGDPDDFSVIDDSDDLPF